MDTSRENHYIRRDRTAIAAWLALCALLVTCMVIVGGYTRLSGSGLSITSWKPIHGVVPPLGDAQWQEEFDAYQQSPQYEKINHGMSLEEFKVIYWPEYFHRLLGRTAGIVFLLPLVIFAFRKSFTAGFGWRLAGIFALGGVQGLIGWLMVKSGLVNDPHVSHYRLALHLITAFAMFGLLLWALLDALSYLAKTREKSTDKSISYYKIWFFLLVFQIIMGALVAGLHAGLVYNTYPAMDGSLIPAELTGASAWRLDNPVFVQFIHRHLAAIVALGFLLWWYSARQHVKNKHLGKVSAAVTATIAVQFALGIMTLLNQVPLPLALLHQLTALALFGMSTGLLHGLTKRNG